MKPTEAMVGVIGKYLYEVKSECLQVDLSDQDVAAFILKVTKSGGGPWRTVPKKQVTAGKGRTLLHWVVAADEAPEFGVYHSGDKAMHIRAVKLPQAEPF